MQHSASDNTSAIVYLSRDSVNLACLSRDIYNSSQISVSQTQLEQFVATHFTCLGASHRYLHIGLTSHLGIHAEYKVSIAIAKYRGIPSFFTRLIMVYSPVVNCLSQSNCLI